MAVKIYSASVTYTTIGSATVEARSKKEAIQKLKDGDFIDILEEDHVGDFTVDETTVEELDE